MNRSYIATGIVIVAAIAWIASGAFDSGADERPAAGVSSPVAPAMTVRVRPLQPVSLPRELALYGSTMSSRKVELRSEIEGTVAALPVARGTQVKRGDVIARIEQDDRQARLAESKAALAAREADYNAASRLNAQGFRADVSLADAKARLDSAKAAVTRMEVELQKTIIRAPFEGVIEQRPVELGSYLGKGALIAMVVDLDPMLIVVQIAEQDIGKIAIGTPGEARLSTGVRLTGKVSFVASMADAATRTYRVDIEAANAGHAAPEGTTAEVKLQLGEIVAHVVPASALTLGENGAIGVKLLDDESIVRFVPVRIVGEVGNDVSIMGLPNSATLITVGQEYVRVGQKVGAVRDLAGAGESSR